jgi:cytidylate kinase
MAESAGAEERRHSLCIGRAAQSNHAMSCRRSASRAGAFLEGIMAVTTDRVLESLARLNQYLDAQLYRDREPKTGAMSLAEPPITIAISRQAGSGGAEIARLTGARLGWPVYDHELLDRIGQEKGLSSRLLAYLDERPIHWLEEAFRTFGSSDSSRDRDYQRGLLHLLASLGEAGHCVIVGRGAAQILPARTTLSVRVIAPRRERIAAVQKRKGLSAAEAERWVDKHDRERAQFVKECVHANADDPCGYDLVLNTGRLSHLECSELIVHAVRAREARPAARPTPV